MSESNGLLREELEGLQRRLARQEQVQQALVDLELEKEVRLRTALLACRGAGVRGAPSRCREWTRGRLQLMALPAERQVGSLVS